MTGDAGRQGLRLGTGLLLVVVPTFISVVTGLWVLTAISIGVLFGFFLQKGDLCGASAISDDGPSRCAHSHPLGRPLDCVLRSASGEASFALPRKRRWIPITLRH